MKGASYPALPRVNMVKERLFFLSPTVQAGLDPEAKLGDFQLINEIGRDQLEITYLGRHLTQGSNFLLRQLSKRALKQFELVETIRNSLKLVYSAQHPNIARVLTHFEEEENLFLVMEYFPGISLKDELARSPYKKLDEKTALKLVKDVICALEYMHSKDFYLPELSVDHITLTENGCLKINDVGWCLGNANPKLMRNTKMVIQRQSPEMIQGRGHTKLSDLWNLGLLIFELLTGSNPFLPTLENLSKKDSDIIIRDHILHGRITYPADFPMFAKDLLNKVFQVDPKKRISLEDIKEHAWLRTVQGLFKKKCEPEQMTKRETVENGSDTKNKDKDQLIVRIREIPYYPRILKKQKGSPKALESPRDLKTVFSPKYIDEVELMKFSVFNNEELEEYCRPDSILGGESTRLDKVFAGENFQFTDSIVVNDDTRRIQELESQVLELQSTVNSKDAEIEEMKKKLKEYETMRTEMGYLNERNQKLLQDNKYLRAVISMSGIQPEDVEKFARQDRLSADIENQNHERKPSNFVYQTLKTSYNPQYTALGERGNVGTPSQLATLRMKTL